MTPTRWQQIEQLYLAAQERDPAALKSFLAEACGDDEELRAKVESMLAHDRGGGKILDISAAGLLLEGSANTVIRGGAQLGPYRIDALLGEGGMGRVYQAFDMRLERPVAIKILHSQFEARFTNEARAISALNHPHICTLHDVGPGYMVMELIEGETLAGRLGQGAVSLDLALQYAIQISGGLAAAHSLGIVHRDLKPGNVMLGKNGAKILDFGLAKFSGPVGKDSQSDPLTGSQALVGTPSYMSPEQLAGKPCDARSDIFSFGFVLYEMVTGRRPFSGESQATVIAKLLRGECPPLDDIPERLAHVIERCLNKDPEARWQSSKDLKLELEWCAAPLAHSMNSVQQISPKRASGRTISVAWLLTAAAITAAVALSLVYFRQPGSETRVVRSAVLPPEKTSLSFGTNAGPVALSPDGRRMVFAATAEDGTSQLWVRGLDWSSAQPLSGSDTGRLPFWSPDSRWIGFFADFKLKKIDTQGGPPIALADVQDATGGSWAANGTIVFSPAAGAGPLLKISSAGGMPAPATTVDPAEGTVHDSPWFLPDGEHFVFAAVNTAGSRGGIHLRVGSLHSTASKLIGSADSQAIYADGRLLYLREGALMAQPFDPKALRTTGEAVPVAERVESLVRPAGVGVFSASGNGLLAYRVGARSGADEWQLTWFDRTGRALATVGEPRKIRQIRISPDGRSLAATFVNGPGSADLWTYDIARGLPTRFTFGPGVNLNPTWSPDGRSIVFSSPRRGHFDLYRKPASGSGVEKLLYADDHDKLPYSWTPDGKFLLYGTVSGGGDLFLLPTPLGPPGSDGTPHLQPVPFRQNEFYETESQFSPDGKWVAYTSKESPQARTAEIFVAPFARPTERHQISSNGGSAPRWRQDGKEIFYLAPGGQLIAAEVRIGKETLDVGAVRTLFGGIPTSSPTPYDITADGQHILAIVPAASSKSPEPITLIQNWTAALKK